MIDWNKSSKLNGMSVEELKAYFNKYPHSDRRIIRICDICKETSNVRFDGHSNLCNLCSKRTPKFRESARLKTMEQFSNLDARKMNRLKSLELWRDPEYRNKLSGENHYLFGEHLSEKHKNNVAKAMVNHYKDPLEREKRSLGMKKYHINHPNTRKKQSERSIERWKDPEFRNMMSDIIKLRYEDPLEHEKLKLAQSLRWKRKRWNDQAYSFINGEPIIDFISSPTNGYDIPSDKYDEWRRSVYARDNYTCQMCGANHCEVHAHHIIPQRMNRNLILVIDNGITLCRSCHELTYGKEKIYETELFEKLENIGDK